MGNVKLGWKKGANTGTPVSFGILLGFLYMLTVTAGQAPALPEAGRWALNEAKKNKFPGVSAASPVVQALDGMTARKLRELVGMANNIIRNAAGTGGGGAMKGRLRSRV
eukprot:gene7650-24076_t